MASVLSLVRSSSVVFGGATAFGGRRILIMLAEVSTTVTSSWASSTETTSVRGVAVRLPSSTSSKRFSISAAQGQVLSGTRPNCASNLILSATREPRGSTKGSRRARWSADALASSVARVLAAIHAATIRVCNSLARACSSAESPSVVGSSRKSAASMARSVARSSAMTPNTASVQ